MKLSNILFLAFAACIAVALNLANADSDSDLFYQQMALIEQEIDNEALQEELMGASSARKRVRRARGKYPYGKGRAGGDEAGKIRLIALDNAVPRSLMRGAPSADQLCREAAARQGYTPNIWRAVIANSLRSLRALLIYENEREKTNICNRDGEVLFDSWLAFLNGGTGSSNPILTFNGTNLDDLSMEYAWFGYLTSTRGNEPLSPDATKPYCGNWMLSGDRDGNGPALYLNGFLESRSVQDNIRTLRCNNNAATLLCVEARVSTDTNYSPFGLTKPRRPRIKGWRRRSASGGARSTPSPRRPTTRSPRRQ